MIAVMVMMLIVVYFGNLPVNTSAHDKTMICRGKRQCHFRTPICPGVILYQFFSVSLLISCGITSSSGADISNVQPTSASQILNTYTTTTKI